MHRRGRRQAGGQLTGAVLALVLGVAVLGATYAWRLAEGIDTMARHAGQRLALLSASLDAELLRFDSLPAVLAGHPLLATLLAAPADAGLRAQANALLEDVNIRTGASVLYLIQPDGQTLAASNWRQAESFVGENYAYRPYFRAALAGVTGKFFAVGATTQIPGVFIAQPVHRGAQVVGVLAVKVELTQLERTWAGSGESVMVVDRHGVVALSSHPEWKFRTLAELLPASRAELMGTRQYYTAPLEPLPLNWLDTVRAAVGGHEFVVAARELDWLDWRMLMLIDSVPARVAAVWAATGAGLLLCMLGVAALYWAQRARRARERLAAQVELERTVAIRTADLAASNARLQEEVVVRAAAEGKLRSAQRALIEANRLAALGQMAAGVAHEINQPLAAMRSFAGNALVFLERGQLVALRGNLGQIIDLIERMARLTAQLKVFAARRQGVAGRAPAGPSMQVVAGWFRERLDAAGVSLECDDGGLSLPLRPDALEQVLSNLVSNSLDALAGRDAGCIILRCTQQAEGLCLEVIDDGAGIEPELHERIRQPFYSTKPLGHGLGLGLSIVADLVESVGGRLEIRARPGGGTCVRACWPAEARADNGGA